MDDHLLFNPDGPALSVLGATPFTVASLLMAWTPAHPEWDILRVRGSKSPDDSRFFDELAAALQFPYYFGENWNAVWDCITDLNWLKGAGFLIVLDSAQHLLSESDNDFQILLRQHADAHDSWRAVTTDFGQRGRLPIAFQSVLACEPEAAEALIERINSVNATFVRL